MRWYEQLLTGTSVAGVVAGLCVVAAGGLALGGLRWRGLSLGIAGVLFSGIALSYLCWRHEILLHLAGGGAPAVAALELGRRQALELVRDLGLVLSVYAIGMQVGPGFLSSLRAQGLRWCLLTITLVALDIGAVLVVHGWLGVDPVAAVGLLSGAVTNTPGLAAAEQALRDVPGIAAGQHGLASVGCAVAYPFGVVGAILSLALLRAALGIDPRREAERFARATRQRPPLASIDLRVANAAMAGRRVGSLAGLLRAPVVVSRLMRDGDVQLPGADTELALGDHVHAVGEDADLGRLAVLLGERSDVDLREAPQQLDVRRLVVTRRRVVGETLGSLMLRSRYGVNVTRVLRAGLELVPDAGFHLNFGDTLVVVGEEARLAGAEALVGNAVGELQHAQLVPVFVGLAAGVLLGSIPLAVGGLPAPLRLGLAGGPLLVALLLGHRGRFGRVSFYLPSSATLMLRDLGIVLFLGCVGLLSGEAFVETIAHGDGWRWLLLGATITLPPLVITGLFARFVLKVDYTALCGVVAGSMTSPPVLAFAQRTAGEGAALAYGAVYPLAMILRVVSAQALVVLWTAHP
jgi:putative transport protein